MNEDFVSFELAKKLKEKGFIGNSEIGGYGGYYYHDGDDVYIQYDSDADNSNIAAEEYLRPTIAQVLKWLREEKKIHISIGYSNVSKWRYIVIHLGDNFAKEPNIWEKHYDSYESSVIAGIEYTLDNLI